MHPLSTVLLIPHISVKLFLQRLQSSLLTINAYGMCKVASRFYKMGKMKTMQLSDLPNATGKISVKASNRLWEVLLPVPCLDYYTMHIPAGYRDKA